MATARNHTVVIKKLKKHIRLLQRKEEQSRHKLRIALNKAKKLGKGV